MLFNTAIRKIWVNHVPEGKKRHVQQGQTLQAYYKVGLDGTNGIQVFQHKPTVENSKISTTTEVYVAAMVPLKLFLVETGKYFILSVANLL